MSVFDFQNQLTVAAITQVWPDNVLLGEAEDSQASSSHSCIKDNSSVCYYFRAFIEASSRRE